MMRSLLLLRHGEAEPAHSGLEDAQRALTERGRLEAIEAAELIQRSRVRLDLLLASPAARAAQTAHIIAAHLDLPQAPLFAEHLYLASSEGLLSTLQRCPERVQSLLLIGHNPGVSELARQLCGDGAAFTLCTCGLCQLDFGNRWEELGLERVVSFALLR